MLSNAYYFLAKFVLIQPRTSPPKICKILQKIVNFARTGPPAPPRGARPAALGRGGGVPLRVHLRHRRRAVRHRHARRARPNFVLGSRIRIRKVSQIHLGDDA